MNDVDTYSARLAEAFKEGQQAKAKGLPVTDSPYSEGTPMGEEWEGGWTQGGIEDADAAPAMITPTVEPGPRPEFAWLPLDKLSVDHRYQRELGATNRAHINRIAREFRWGFCTPLVVAKGEDGYLIIDGQHRYEGAKRHPEVNELPCWVIDADSVEDQAKAFKALNSARIGVSPLHRFWASLAAREPMALRLKELCDGAGLTISRSKTKDLPPLTLAYIPMLERMTIFGDAAIGAALKLIVEAQGHVADVFRPATVGALVKIVYEAGADFDRPLWLTTLKGADLEGLEAMARADRAKAGGTVEDAMEKRLRRAFERAGGARKTA